jgi:diguanylate cyclase (GGDEF)-like protein
MNPFLFNQTWRILVIDDNEAIHADFRKILTSRRPSDELAGDEEAIFGQRKPMALHDTFEIDCALQGKEGCDKAAAAAAAGKPYHLAFVDMRMPPGWDGVQTIEKLWTIDPQLHVVICSAYSDYSWERIIGTLGATDRLLILKKPFDDLEVSQIATALTAKWLATEQAKMRLSEMEKLVQLRTAELKQAALVDKLTGLPNRELLNDRLSQLIHYTRRDPTRKFAVLFLDFDRFKVVNDSLGHSVGDMLLIAIAERLLNETRGTDTVASLGTAARLGGDEFIVVLDHLRDFHDAARVTERLLETLRVPYNLKGHTVHTTASVGITTSAVAYSNPDDMIRDADTAMYRAKAAGKARYMLFDQKMHEDAVKRLTLEDDLRQAIDLNQLFVNYQPIVSLSNSSPVGFEALVRWQHPKRGLISPLDFISLAEEIGVIVPLGYFVLTTACRQLADWRKRRPEFCEAAISVNLSRKQLAAPDLVERVAQILAETGIRPHDLKLEITESSIMENPDEAVRVLGQIRALGVELHMDDFGTGYSSLSCLHRFPITGLKIDRAFVEDVQIRRDAAALIKAIVNLAHDLGIQVVAEGLEMPAQVAFLQALECDMGQGFRFAKPLSAEAAEKYFVSTLLPAAAESEVLKPAI